MHGIVSLLDEKHYRLVEHLWADLEQSFELKGIKVTPFPHFSWNLASDFNYPDLESVLQRISSSVRPFKVTTTGVGLFTGEKPTIYLPVVKTVELLRYHGLIWDLTASASQGRSPLYCPEQWMPHISLAYDDVTKQNIGPLMEHLAFQSFNWEMTIDNIALIYEPSGTVGILKNHYKFAKPQD